MEQLHDLRILNNPNSPTRLPTQHNQSPTSPDVTLCSPELSTKTTWETIHDLSSDHLPIIITHTLKYPPYKPHKRCFINYKKADWPKYTQQIEDSLQNFDVNTFQNVSSAISHINKAIIQASNKYIPRGYRKQYNPN